MEKEYTISSGAGKTQPSRHLTQLFIGRGVLGILDLDTKLSYTKN